MNNMCADPGVPLGALEIDRSIHNASESPRSVEIRLLYCSNLAALYCILMLILLRKRGLFPLNECTLSMSFCTVIGQNYGHMEIHFLFSIILEVITVLH